MKVVCPAQTDKNPSGVSSLSQTIPNTPAGSPTQILTKSDYVSTTTTASACTFSTFVLLDAASGNPLTSSWLTVDASGNVKVDQNKKGKLTVKMRYTYGG